MAEAKYPARFHVVLQNSIGCELDGRFASSEEDIKGALLNLIEDCVIDAGDVIRIIEVER